jgi:hypothetical protein
MIIRLLLALLCCATCNFGFYESKTWLDLLYYEKIANGYISLTKSDHFFVTKNGRFDPKQEYLESLLLVNSQDENFKKKFPLRYKLIAEKNDIEYLPIVDVKKDVKRATIAFPNRYMGNPASMFGHLFVILNSEYGLYHSDIVHFIADASSSNGVNYVLNGLSGKFKGAFVRDKYYIKIKEYTYSEDRQLYFYNLALSSKQIYELQLHIMELRGVFFDYYFLEKNCAYFIAKLLNNISEDSIEMGDFVVLPSDIINNLISNKKITERYFKPSSNSFFEYLYNELSYQEKKDVKFLLFNPHSKKVFSDNSLKSFLYVSNYAIHNFSDYAGVIRSNRIYAYRSLLEKGVSFERPTINSFDSVEPVISRFSGAYVSSDKRYQLWYKPISYGNLDEFFSLQTKKVSLFSPSLSLDEFGAFQFQFQTAEILNRVPYNVVLANNSWKIQQSIYVKDTNVYFDADFSFGLGVPFKNKMLLTSSGGITASNFNSLDYKDLGYFGLMPLYEVELSYNNLFNLRPFSAAVSFVHRCKRDYINVNAKWLFGNNKVLELGIRSYSKDVNSYVSLGKLF